MCIRDRFLCIAAAEDCARRSDICQSHGSDNANGWYYSPGTYSASNLTKLCERYPSDDDDDYRRQVRSHNSTCSGRWCRASEWACQPAGSHTCYEVELILPDSVPSLD